MKKQDIKEVIIDDKSIASRHCAIKTSKELGFIKSIDQKAEISIDNRKLKFCEEGTLKNKSQVQIGEIKFVYSVQRLRRAKAPIRPIPNFLKE